ncbi:19223_t:CDS:2 [Racocetra persica]|uniref:19223_t:CDS:1 n=1 Tax=Racocetra persica TaxID=160502 RepID=A0ACA9KF28_9GLOM|nr:19223_t:CDS:2 [Racocetra persica]
MLLRVKLLNLNKIDVVSKIRSKRNYKIRNDNEKSKVVCYNNTIRIKKKKCQLLADGYNSDVIIQAGDGKDVQEFRVHSLILRVINFDSLDGIIILQILIAADELNLDRLLNRVNDYLISKHAEFIRKDPGQILQITFKYESCSKLRDYCLKTISESPEILFSSPDFLSLDKSIFLLLLERDELKMENIDIWKYMLTWGASQISNTFTINDVSHDISRLKDLLQNIDIFSLKNLLQDLIPLIKWLEISSAAFWQNVVPFKELFPDDLFWAIIGCHLDPTDESVLKSLPQRCLQSLPLLDSVIFDSKHFSIITNWIKKQDMDHFEKKNLTYSFSRLLRASRDGSPL